CCSRVLPSQAGWRWRFMPGARPSSRRGPEFIPFAPGGGGVPTNLFLPGVRRRGSLGQVPPMCPQAATSPRSTPEPLFQTYICADDGGAAPVHAANSGFTVAARRAYSSFQAILAGSCTRGRGSNCRLRNVVEVGLADTGCDGRRVGRRRGGHGPRAESWSG